MTGVYKITNQKNKKSYIGQSVNIQKRAREHLNSLEKGQHHSILLQRAWDLYGPRFFSFEILKECEREELDRLEIIYIEKFDSYRNGYNMNSGGEGNKNLFITREAKEKMRAAKIGLYEGKDNPFYGKKHSEETKAKISENRKGKCTGKNHPMYGKTPSEKTLQAIKAANTGRRRTEEEKRHLRELNKGSKSSSAREVIADGLEWGCGKDAAKYFGIKYKTFNMYLRGARTMPKHLQEINLRYRPAGKGSEEE